MGRSGRTQRLSIPILEQMWEVSGHKDWVDHVVPAEALHDRLDWVGLKVMGGRGGLIKGQQCEA